MITFELSSNRQKTGVMRWRLDGIGIFPRGRIVSVAIETHFRGYSIPGGFGLGRLKSGNGRNEMVKIDLRQTEILKLPLEIRRRILADGAEACTNEIDDLTMEQLLELEQSLQLVLSLVDRRFWDLKKSSNRES